MTVLTRWEPFRELSTLQDRINRAFRESYPAGAHDESLTTSSFAPAVDVYEDEHQVTLKIEVPGIDEKDIDVQVENHTLTVHGERKIEKEEKEENYRRVERQYGSFTRTFTLPQTVDSENVYWTDYGNACSSSPACRGSVMKLPLAGGTPTTLASGRVGPTWIAVDATRVYWVNYGGGSASGAEGAS